MLDYSIANKRTAHEIRQINYTSKPTVSCFRLQPTSQRLVGGWLTALNYQLRLPSLAEFNETLKQITIHETEKGKHEAKAISMSEMCKQQWQAVEGEGHCQYRNIIIFSDESEIKTFFLISFSLSMPSIERENMPKTCCAWAEKVFFYIFLIFVSLGHINVQKYSSP